MARKGNKSKRGRKNSKKSKKIAQNYNKKEFSEVFCQTCLICVDSCDFCYGNLYKHEPKPFINNVFNNLVDTHATYQAFGRSMKSLSIEQFENTICRTGICYDGDVFASAGCEFTTDCYKLFMAQTGIVSPCIIHERNKSNLISFKNNKPTTKYVTAYRKRKRKKKARQVYASYPTFFARDNADFQAAIKRILYGDNDIQQDTDKELSGRDSGTADRHTKGGEPKV